MDVALLITPALTFPSGGYTPVRLGLHTPTQADVSAGATDRGYGQSNWNDPDPNNPKNESSAYGAGTLRSVEAQRRFAPSSSCTAYQEEVDALPNTGVYHGDSGGPSFDHRTIKGGSKSYNYFGLLGVHNTGVSNGIYACNALTNNYLLWMDAIITNTAGGSGFFVTPLIEPGNRKLYVASGTSGNKADLPPNSAPVGTQWHYNPSTKQITNFVSNQCLVGSVNGSDGRTGTNLYVSPCGLSGACEQWIVTNNLAIMNNCTGKCLVNATLQNGRPTVTSSDQSSGPKAPYLDTCDNAYDQMWYWSYNL
jgi:hypothetical protein